MCVSEINADLVNILLMLTQFGCYNGNKWLDWHSTLRSVLEERKEMQLYGVKLVLLIEIGVKLS